MNLFKGLSIQSKLIIMLLAVAIASIVIVGWISYSSARDALTTAAFNQLTNVRASKKIQIEAFFKTIRSHVSNLAADRMIIDFMREEIAGFDKFRGMAIKPEWDQKLRAFYQSDFLPALAKGTGQTPRFESLYPRTPEALYAQYLYIANNPYPHSRLELNDAGDGSDYSRTHARYQSILARLVQDFHYDNLILADAKTGDVVYTLTKSPLFGTNLLDGPYSESRCAAAFRALRKSSNVGEVLVEDFSPMTSAEGKPVGFMGSAIYDGPTQIGVLLMQFPTDEINRVMTDDFGWVQDGLGKTGEVYLVGPDMLMRSRSRLLHEDPKRYFELLQQLGYAPSEIERVRRAGTATLSQPVRTPAAQAALEGKSGTNVQVGYLGATSLASYAPLDIPGLRWVVIASMHTDEAFEPLRALTEEVMIASLAMILVVTVGASWLGRGFAQPILRLVDSVMRLQIGEKQVAIQVNSNDEFADLAVAFNQISGTFGDTRHALARRTQERDDLLDSMLPPEAAARMKEGRYPLVDEYAEISVFYANILLSTEAGREEAEKSLTTLNDLVIAFDDAAEGRGVEQLSSNGATYVACCGLSKHRVDHAARMVDFAQDVLKITRRLHRERHVSIRVQIGLDCGPVAGGIVGRKHFGYYIAGETISTARALARQALPDTILVSDQIHDSTPSLYPFHAAIEATPPGGSPITAWPLRVDSGVVPERGPEETKG